MDCSSKIEKTYDLMMLLGLNDQIDQLTIVISEHWYGHVMRRAVWFMTESRWKDGRPRTLKKQVGDESIMVGLSREDLLF